MLTIQKIIQIHRKKRKLSQADVANLAEVTQAMVSNVESGKDVRLSTLRAIAKVLNLEIVAVTQQQAFQLTLQINSRAANNQAFSLLEQIQVKDDE